MDTKNKTHTPGPWKARYIPHYGSGDVWCVDWSADQEEVVEICHGEANARLIAAAPAMLAALKEAKRHAGCSEDCDLVSGPFFNERKEDLTCSCGAMHLYRECATAIALAEGAINSP